MAKDTLTAPKAGARQFDPGPPNPSKRKSTRTHTVRFYDENEDRLVDLMAAAEGVSTGEWLANAARIRMRYWLMNGWDLLAEDKVAVVLSDLDEKVGDADQNLEDLTIGGR